MTAAMMLVVSVLAATPWQGRTIDGQEVQVPAGKSAVLLFMRPGQKQSEEALGYLRQLAGDDVQWVVIVSGLDADMRARQAQKDDQLAWPICADPEFAATNAFNVHVWPTTVALDKEGNEIAHVAGLPSSYFKDMGAYLDRLRGKLDDQALKQRLAQNDVIEDSPHQAASRHLKVAQQMAERRRPELARVELDKAIALQAEDPAQQIMIADLLSQLGEAQKALDLLAKLPEGVAPPWRTALIRGRCLVELGKPAEAEPPLRQATMLNPHPCEAWYLLGRVAEQAGNKDEAVKAYRKAFETSTEGRARLNAR